MFTLNTEELTVVVPGSIYRVPLELRVRKSLKKLGDVMLIPPVNGKSHLYLNLKDQAVGKTYQKEILLGLSQYLFATQGVNEIKIHGFDQDSKTIAPNDLMTPHDVDLLGQDSPHIETVIVVLLTADKQVLLGKRPEGKFMSGVWEFPGGKVEKGESIMAAAARELYEEIGILIHDYQSLRTIEFNFQTFTMKGYISVVSNWEGEPQPLIHSELKWVSIKELPQYSMPLSNLICIHDILTLAK